jgi:hypothetical protein
LLLHFRLQDCDVVCEDVPVTVHELQCKDATTEVEQCVNVPKQSCEKVGCWRLCAVWMYVLRILSACINRYVGMAWHSADSHSRVAGCCIRTACQANRGFILQLISRSASGILLVIKTTWAGFTPC